jgi:hypothetical protein
LFSRERFWSWELSFPGFWPEPASLWQEVALHAALLTILTALALLVVFSLLEKNDLLGKSSPLENQL